MNSNTCPSSSVVGAAGAATSSPGWVVRHRGMIRGAAVVLLSTVLGLVTSVADTLPSRAAGEAQCTFTLDVTFSPGLSAQASSGSFTTGGPTGIMDCSGPVNGDAVTGRAPMATDGRYGTRGPDSCASGLFDSGEGTAVDRITFPTTGGHRYLVDRLTFHYGHPSTSGGLVSGTFEGEHCRGTFELTPTEGDCITSPVTRAHVTGHEVLRT